MDLGSTQLVTHMIASGISWGLKEAGVLGLHSCHFHLPLSRNFVRLKLLKPERPVQACHRVV